MQLLFEELKTVDSRIFFYGEHAWELTPPSHTPKLPKSSHLCSVNMNGTNSPLMNLRGDRFFSPRMFTEHTWENDLHWKQSSAIPKTAPCHWPGAVNGRAFFIDQLLLIVKIWPLTAPGQWKIPIFQKYFLLFKRATCHMYFFFKVNFELKQSFKTSVLAFCIKFDLNLFYGDFWYNRFHDKKRKSCLNPVKYLLQFLLHFS